MPSIETVASKETIVRQLDLQLHLVCSFEEFQLEEAARLSLAK